MQWFQAHLLHGSLDISTSSNNTDISWTASAWTCSNSTFFALGSMLHKCWRHMTSTVNCISTLVPDIQESKISVNWAAAWIEAWIQCYTPSYSVKMMNFERVLCTTYLICRPRFVVKSSYFHCSTQRTLIILLSPYILQYLVCSWLCCYKHAKLLYRHHFTGMRSVCSKLFTESQFFFLLVALFFSALSHHMFN